MKSAWKLEKKENPVALLKDAKKLHRQALKKKGQTACELFQKAVAKYEHCLVIGLDETRAVEVQIFKGDCFFQWGQKQITEMESLPIDQLDVSVEREGFSKSCELFQAAVQSYKQTMKGCGEWDLDSIALVNCGNTLSTWAEYCLKDECISLLQNAIKCYRHSLEMNPTDLEVQLHLGDALIQLAEALGENNQREDCALTFKEAMKAFEDAFTQWNDMAITSHVGHSCDQSLLLLRWGIGAITAAEHSLDKEMKISYLDKAIYLLKQSIELNSHNVESFNSLGNAFESYANIVEDGEALDCLDRALQQGYEAAKRISKNNIDAALGIAEVYLMMGKIHLKAGLEVTAREQFSETIQRYERILKSRAFHGNFQTYTQALYNYACCCALAGKESLAKMTLEQLLQKQGTSIFEISTDKDLKTLSHYVWFQDLINKEKNTSTLFV